MMNDLTTVPLQSTTEPLTLINGETCIHHWVLEPVGLTPAGECVKCGKARVFTNKIYDKPGDAGIRPTEKQRQAINSDLKAREFIANGLVRQQRYD
jgi:hypothetical protein